MISFLVLLGIVVCFSAILALALNFQWGLGGMVNFGLAGFYTLGAYSCALLILKGGANTLVATLGAMAIVAAACAATAHDDSRISPGRRRMRQRRSGKRRLALRTIPLDMTMSRAVAFVQAVPAFGRPPGWTFKGRAPSHRCVVHRAQGPGFSRPSAKA